jgi:amino acid transporter
LAPLGALAGGKPATSAGIISYINSVGEFMAIDDTLVEQVRAGLRDYIAPHRHSSLLGAIILAFAVRPLIGDSVAGSALFSIALMVLLLVAFYSVNVDEMAGEKGRLGAESNWRLRLGWVLAIAAGLARLFAVVVQNSMLDLVFSIFWLLFLVFVTFSQLRSVLKQREVTGETICMAVSIYLLLGLCWALLYAVIFQQHPESFAGLPPLKSGQPPEIQSIFPILGYFSLTTLSTVGYGDITPLTLQARYAAVAEGIAGQFYLAILVARLVGLQMTQFVSPQTQNQASPSADASGGSPSLAAE